MSTLLNSLNRQSVSASAHPLFPRSQAFLWLPGFSGHALPFCSYNYRWDTDEAADAQVEQANDAPLRPAHPVSQETFIAWNTTVVPPFPYHPVPVIRPLTTAEIDELGKKVAEACLQTALEGVHPVRNENKHILLAQAGLLASRTEDVSRVA